MEFINYQFLFVYKFSGYGFFEDILCWIGLLLRKFYQFRILKEDHNQQMGFIDRL